MGILKYWLIALLGMTLIWSMSPKASHISAGPSSSTIAIPQVIRFRVIANSDNPIDQALKLDVRDRILETLDPVLNGVKNRSQAAARIERMEPKLALVANHVLAHYHAAYRAQVHWTRTLFPTKAYGSWVLPAGRYRALLIVLGKGEGHNWWCVLFPSLCFIDMGNALAVPAQPAVVPSAPHQRGHRIHHPLRHLASRHGRLKVSWQLPGILTTVLAILRN